MANSAVFVVYYYDGYDYSPPVRVFDSAAAADEFCGDINDTDLTWEAFIVETSIGKTEG